jgi:fatty-acyl-CoA synthase
MLVPLSVFEFRDRAELYFRDKVGVIDGDKAFTYGQYAERTHKLANALRRLGVQKGDRVSFICYNTHHLLEAYYGVLEAGAILNPINIRLAPPEIAYILNHSASKVLFYHKDFAPLIENIKASLSATQHYVVVEGQAGGLATHEYEALLATGSADYRPLEFDENDIAELFYTSGTTGQPKGVALTHRSLHLHGIYSALSLKFGDDDVIIHVVPLFHSNGWGIPHSITMQGGTHVMLRQFDLIALLDLIQKYRATYLFGVPLIFNALINLPNIDQYDLSSIKYFLTGGSAISPALIQAMQEKLGKGKTLSVVGYGMTETAPLLAFAWPRQHLNATDTPQKAFERRALTGWPVAGIQMRVVDQHGRDVRPDGQQLGEIIVRSNTVMHSYYKDPEATAAALREGWFHTGDMAVMDDQGYVLIKDRSKEIIISGGENISSSEIENTLAVHPAVLECAVVAAPDDQWGEIPIAIVVLKPGQTATGDDLIAHCRAHLAGFKIPKRIEFRDSLPKGGTGKILKAELREPFWQGQEKRVH